MIAFAAPGRAEPPSTDRRASTREAAYGSFETFGRVDRAPVDPAAVIDLEARYGQALFGFVRRLGLSDNQAADCVQEVMLRLWATLDGGTIVLDHKAWAFRAIYRLAMDEYRVRRRVAGLVASLGRRLATAPLIVDADDRIAVWAEVDRLPPRQRQVVYLRYRADLTYGEVAEVLGITASAARSHATQAMTTLRARLADRPLGEDGA